jgi:hypothetical protein
MAGIFRLIIHYLFQLNRLNKTQRLLTNFLMNQVQSGSGGLLGAMVAVSTLVAVFAIALSRTFALK